MPRTTALQKERHAAKQITTGQLAYVEGTRWGDGAQEVVCRGQRARVRDGDYGMAGSWGRCQCPCALHPESPWAGLLCVPGSEDCGRCALAWGLCGLKTASHVLTNPDRLLAVLLWSWQACRWLQCNPAVPGAERKPSSGVALPLSAPSWATLVLGQAAS